MKIKISIVDDKQSNRNLLANKLQKGNFDIVFMANNGADFLEKMNDSKANLPDIVLMDLEMPIMDGIDAIANASVKFPDVKFIVLTVFDEDEKIFRAIKAGACGYLLKEETGDAIVENLIMAYEIGAVPMSPSIARKTLTLLSKSVLPQSEKEELKNQSFFDLTEREIDILKLLVQGKEYKQIAEALFLSPFTIRNHTTNIYQKLHVNSKAEAIALAYKRKLI